MDEKRTSDRNKQILQRFYDEVANEGNLHVVEELLAESFVEHDDFPGIPPTREGVKQFFTLLRTAFPDITFEVEHLLGEGVFVSSRARAHGTHQGEFMGVPGTGRPVDVQVFDLVQVIDGAITAHWGVFDALGLMQQIGAVEPPPPPPAPS